MVRIGWTKCYHCGYEQQTYAKIGNRIKCRRPACGRTFKVKVKLSSPVNISEKKGTGFTRADKLM